MHRDDVAPGQQRRRMPREEGADVSVRPDSQVDDVEAPFSRTGCRKLLGQVRGGGIDPGNQLWTAHPMNVGVR